MESNNKENDEKRLLEICESGTDLIIEENTIYEVDCECLRRKNGRSQY